jgi:hypothetical protein
MMGILLVDRIKDVCCSDSEEGYRYRKDFLARGDDAVCGIAAKGSRRRPPRMGVEEQYTHMYTGGRLDRSRPTHLVCSQ